MTDDSGAVPESKGTEGGAGAAFSAAKESLNASERMIAFGALVLVIGVYLIGDVAMDEWGVSNLTLAASVGALALMYMVKTKGRSYPLPYNFALKVMAYVIGLLGVTEVLWFIEGGRAEGMEIVFALAYFVGVIAMVMGARQLTD
ncbi:MAG: hypothetical protein R3246_16975 [Acidimicrobiia bacterium]|nr:hypothetical protein [Acidimicrobiia bacterium]